MCYTARKGNNLSLLEAQLLSNYIKVSQSHSVPHSLTGRLAFMSISPLFVDRFGSSLRFSHLEFDREAISDVKTLDFGGRF